MKHLYAFSILLLFAVTIARSQQDPQYTQYLYNPNIVNPAHTYGEVGLLNAGLLYRAQWVGVEGAPDTFNVFGYIPLDEKIQVGLSLVRDDIGAGALVEDNLYADFAYVLQLSRQSKLSLGLKAGFTFFNSNFNDFVFDDQTIDPAFNQDINEVFPNIGVGAHFFTGNFFAGFSALNLLNAKHLDQEDGLVNRGREEVHYYLTSGYTFDITPGQFSLKPSILARAVAGAPLIFDLNMNAIIYERLELGIGYRTSESVVGMFNFRLTPRFRVGYAYDRTLNNLGNFGSGSHEVFVLFDVDFTGRNPSTPF